MRSRARYEASSLLHLRDYFDWPLFLVVAGLAVIGVLNLYSATSVAHAPLNESHIQQLYWIVGAAVIAGVAASIDYAVYERIAYAVYGAGIIGLVLVFILGREVRGSSRWIHIGQMTIQPSELMKLCLVLGLAKHLHQFPKQEARTLRELVIPALICALPAALVLLQPDLGTAMILSLIFLSTMVTARIERKTLLTLGGFALLLVPFFYFYGLKGYQSERITAWLHPEQNILSFNWDPHHARIAIGNGGLFGRGFLKGSQNQFLFLHEQHSDFPFPVFAEEWGFMGGLVLVGLYAALVVRALQIASNARDTFGAAVAVGVAAIVFWHAAFNLGMVTGLLPIVGVGLPLFSYGGSSLLTMMLGIGLLMSISVRSRRRMVGGLS